MFYPNLWNGRIKLHLVRYTFPTSFIYILPIISLHLRFSYVSHPIISLSHNVYFSFVHVYLSNLHTNTDGEKMINDGQWYRLFIYHLTFGSIGELILGTVILAGLMRRYEREVSLSLEHLIYILLYIPIIILFFC